MHGPYGALYTGKYAHGEMACLHIPLVVKECTRVQPGAFVRGLCMSAVLV